MMNMYLWDYAMLLIKKWVWLVSSTAIGIAIGFIIGGWLSAEFIKYTSTFFLIGFLVAGYLVWLDEYINYNQIKQELEDYKNKEDDLSPEAKKLLFDIYSEYKKCPMDHDIGDCDRGYELKGNEKIYFKLLIEKGFFESNSTYSLGDSNPNEYIIVSKIKPLGLKYLEDCRLKSS